MDTYKLVNVILYRDKKLKCFTVQNNKTGVKEFIHTPILFELNDNRLLSNISVVHSELGITLIQSRGRTKLNNIPVVNIRGDKISNVYMWQKELLSVMKPIVKKDNSNFRSSSKEDYATYKVSRLKRLGLLDK